MHFSRSSALIAIASLSNFVKANPNSTCNAFGIDFQDGGSYFINSASTDNFTFVTQFSGCNEDEADAWFVPPSGDEIDCSQIPTLPDNTNELSTCPIQKDQLSTGDYILIVFGNNGDGNPYGFQRDFHLNVGTQVTTTVTPTVTVSVTTTPHATSTNTSTIIVTSTLNATTTYTVPAVTAPATKTVLPRPVTVYTTKTITWKRTAYAPTLVKTTVTATASCTVPPRRPTHDPYIHYHPKRFHPAVLNSRHHKERAANPQGEPQRRTLHARAPDEPTVTSTFTPVVNVTATITAPTVTDVASALVTTTTFAALPPSTIKSGTYTVTITLPTPTRTKISLETSVGFTRITKTYTWTHTTTTTPASVSTACLKSGGHFGGGWRW